MAHYLAGTATGPGAATDFFNQLIAHMKNNGWTEQVVVNATTKLMKGTPLDSTADNAPYVYVNVNSTTTVQIICRFDWNTDPAGDHSNVGTAACNMTVSDSSFAFWVRCNGHAVAIVTKVGTTYDKVYAGHLRRSIPAARAGVSKTTAALAIGATVLPLASDMTGKLQVGQKVMIRNYAHNTTSANKANAEVVTISAITGGASPSLTVSALTKAYDAGALVGQHPDPTYLTQPMTGSLTVTGYAMMALDGSSATSYATSFQAYTENIRGSFGYFDADVNDGYALGWHSIVSTGTPNGYYGTMYHFLSVTTEGTLANEDVLDDGTGNTYLVVQAPGSGSAATALGPMD